MQRRNREVNVISVSALDLFCSGMGAIMVLMMILMPYYMRPDSTQSQRLLQEARTQAQAAETRAQQAETRAQAAEARAKAAEARAAEGLEIQVPLGIKVAWQGRGVDLDLYVQKGSEVVWAHNPLMNWGVLTRDENTTRSDQNQETFFVPRFTKGLSEGRYQVYVAFFDWPERNEGPGPFHVTGSLSVLPGTPREQRNAFQFNVARSETWDSPDNSNTLPVSNRRCQLAFEFEITLASGSSGDRDEDFQVRFTSRR